MPGIQEALPPCLLPLPPTAARVQSPEYPSCCLSSASSPTPEKPSSQFRRGRMAGEETALLWACYAAGSVHVSVHCAPEPVCLSLPSLPNIPSQGCEHSPHLLSLIFSVPGSHPLAPISLLCSSSQKSPKSLSLEFQGPVLSPDWLLWAPVQLLPCLSLPS